LQTASESFQVALNHLPRVQTSWDDPLDWTILSTFSFYCLEACVVAAVLHSGRSRPRHHQQKVQEAKHLSVAHGLPDVSHLLVDLNDMRKHVAYGDIGAPENLDPQDVANDVEEYVEAVRRLLAR